MLPPPAVKKIKFITKTTITGYIEEDQVLSIWGGFDDWIYEFVPEKEQQQEEEKKRSVSFSSEVKDHSSLEIPSPSILLPKYYYYFCL
uniref:Uncharacterized protein n=1 Tax=Lepeophtheirus salmonis TaxID=72036 RepID=A0A0K2UEL9_LEPSM